MSKKEIVEKPIKVPKVTAEQASKAVTTSKKRTTLIYCGPTINNGEIQQFAVFQGKLPEYVEKHAEAEVAVKELLVPVEELSKVKKQLYIKGTREHLLFEKALNYVKGGGKQ